MRRVVGHLPLHASEPIQHVNVAEQGVLPDREEAVAIRGRRGLRPALFPGELVEATRSEVVQRARLGEIERAGQHKRLSTW